MTVTQVQPRELAGLEEIAFDPARLNDDGWVREISEGLRNGYGFIVKNVVEQVVRDAEKGTKAQHALSIGDLAESSA